VRKRKARQFRGLANAQGAATAPGQAALPGQARPQLQPGRGQVRARRRRGPARQTRWMRLLGLFFATGGGVAIGFGWAGAAQKDCVQCQIPFLLSGGAAGVGLIIFGVALMLLAQIRTESRRLGDRVEHAVAVLRRATERDAGHEGGAQAPGAPEMPMTAPAEEPSVGPVPTSGAEAPIEPLDAPGADQPGGPVGVEAGEARQEPFGVAPFAPTPDPLTSAPVDPARRRGFFRRRRPTA
jgi:hypothetical protein